MDNDGTFCEYYEEVEGAVTSKFIKYSWQVTFADPQWDLTKINEMKGEVATKKLHKDNCSRATELKSVTNSDR